MNNISIMTFNIMHGLDYISLHDKKIRILRYDKVCDLVKRYNPDILCINEIYGSGFNKENTEFFDHVSYLKGLLKYKYAHFAKAIDAKNGEYGNAIFSNLEFKIEEEIHIPDPIIKDEDTFYESRVMTKYNFDSFNVIHTHFGLAKSEEINAYDTFKKLNDNNKTILLGDFNITPDNDIIKDLLLTYKEATLEKYKKVIYTHKSIEPFNKIDYIFYKGLDLIDSQVINEVVSDHFPIYASFKF